MSAPNRKGLTRRELEVIILRYGLRSGRPMRLDEVGKVLDLSRERVRVIDHHARAAIGHAVIHALARSIRVSNAPEGEPWETLAAIELYDDRREA